MEVDVKSEIDLADDDAANKDLCISLGGDNTFLKTAALIKGPSQSAILGINSHPELHRGKLCDLDIFFEDRELQAKRLTEHIMAVGTEKESAYIDWQVRSRIHGEMHQYHGNCPTPEEFE